jgi:hypothetical protein
MRAAQLRDRKFWVIIAFVFVVRTVPLAVAIGVAFAVRPTAGRLVAGVIAASVFLASRYLFNRFALPALLRGLERRLTSRRDD